MSDLSHWDFATEFRNWEAASLMAGVDPVNFDYFKANTYPIARRLEQDSINSFAVGERWVRESTAELECCKPQRTKPMFERAEIVRWLGVVGLRSAYRFDLSQIDVVESPDCKEVTQDDGVDKYRIIQDRLFESDFDRLIMQISGERDPGSKEE